METNFWCVSINRTKSVCSLELIPDYTTLLFSITNLLTEENRMCDSALSSTLSPFNHPRPMEIYIIPYTANISYNFMPFIS